MGVLGIDNGSWRVAVLKPDGRIGDVGGSQEAVGRISVAGKRL